MSDKIKYVSDDTFETEVLNAEMPVLVDFYADWCGPCKMLSPIVEEVAGEYMDKVKIVKINVDQNNMTPQKYGVRGIPTLILFKDGEVEVTKVGSLSKSQLTAFIDSHI